MRHISINEDTTVEYVSAFVMQESATGVHGYSHILRVRIGSAVYETVDAAENCFIDIDTGEIVYLHI